MDSSGGLTVDRSSGSRPEPLKESATPTLLSPYYRNKEEKGKGRRKEDQGQRMKGKRKRVKGVKT